MTAQDIRAMDGPALTRVAWALGLALPCGPGQQIQEDMESVWVCRQGRYGFIRERRWEPHTDLDQAHGVFRQLRARGWYCETSWSPRGGQVNVWHPPSVLQSHIVCRYGQAGQDTEALALLRVSVLAVASEPQEPQEPPTP